MEAVEFLEWLRTARPGDRRHYHTGLLVSDREYLPALDVVAAEIYRAYRDGLVVPVQRRAGPACEYMVVAL